MKYNRTLFFAISLCLTSNVWATHGSNGSQAAPPVPPAQPTTQAEPSVGAGVNTVRQIMKSVLPGNAPIINSLDDAVLGNDAVRELLTRATTPEAPQTTLHSIAGRWFTGDQPRLDMALSGGAAMFRVGSRTDVAPMVSMRFGKRQSPWSFEAGSILPHETPDAFQTAGQTTASSLSNARLESFYEVHAAGIYTLPHGTRNWVAPELGLGVSILHAVDVVNDVSMITGSDQYNGNTYNYSYELSRTEKTRRYGWSPLVRLGVVLFPQSLISLRVDAAYVGYANTAHAFGQAFDLGVSGLMVQQTVQIRL